jgi:hypothetical protein
VNRLVNGFDDDEVLSSEGSSEEDFPMSFNDLTA